jgi:hypothetical protein
MTLLRSLLSLEFAEVHTSHWQAIMGTPLLVPVPKKVMVNGGEITVVKIRIYTWSISRTCPAIRELQFHAKAQRLRKQRRKNENAKAQI